MLLDPRAPLIFGAIMILLLAGYLTMYHAMPGDLAASHARVPGLSELTGCRSCHAPEGLASGCLSCHEEIGSQLATQTGYHHHLLATRELECAGCHVEHLGEDFPLVTRLAWGDLRDNFEHPHVVFDLSGRHESLECDDCHDASFRAALRLSRFPELQRTSTFLGLTQKCNHCHEDVHAGGLSDACDTCHSQDGFRPAVHFDHGVFFELVGGHERAECSGCHVIPEVTDSTSSVKLLPFDEVRGTACFECHDSPHRAPFGDDCEQCHPAPEPEWSAAVATIDADSHALSGFPLTKPHDDVACEECHNRQLPFDERYPDPAAVGYRRKQETCEGCHEDEHDGQFRGRYSGCLACHEQEGFLPHSFSREAHDRAFALSGAHTAVPCDSCHLLRSAGDGPRLFAGTAHECKVCHADPHGGQFETELRAGDCTSCHEDRAVSFTIEPYDHEARTGYALTGAHGKTTCDHCHKDGRGEPPVRRYRDTPTACSACHVDVHHGQFIEDGRVDCARCHVSTTDWRIPTFDHGRQTRFALDGTHARIPCEGCHPPARAKSGVKFVQYRPLGRECKDCHDFVPE